MGGNRKGSVKLAAAQVEVSKARAAKSGNLTILQGAVQNFEKVLQEVRDYVAATEVGVSADTDKARLGCKRL